MIDFLVAIVVVLLIAGLVVYLVESLPFIPAQFKLVIRVLVVVILILWLLQAMGFIGYFGWGPRYR